MADGKHTRGPVEATGSIYEHMAAEVRAVEPGSERGIAQVWKHENAFADAQFIAEAFNVATETGLTPIGLLALANRHRADAQRLLEQRSELLSALIGLLPQTFTGAPDRKNEIAHWERERALGNGRAPLVLAAFAAISRATVTP